MEEKILATKIINKIRQHPEWEPNHRTVKYGDVGVGYYDTQHKGRYFELKYDNIEYTNHELGYRIAYCGGRRQSTFDLMAWLKQLDNIVKPQKPCVEEIVINGIKYVPET